MDEDEKKLKRTSSMIILNPFLKCKIVYPPRTRLSSYPPSCHMMDLVVHEINNELCTNYNFKKATSYYHPYILRLYFGVLFWIQCLRARLDVDSMFDIESEHHQFLNHFLSCYPPETLPIPGPLLPLFKTLCSSQPEFPNYGEVYPRLPSLPGPSQRNKFMREDVEHFFLPNVPGIFALLTDLHNYTGGNPGVFPRKGGHVPVTEQAVVFGHHNFPDVEHRSSYEDWFLVSPGLQYPCEADQRINEAFAEYYPCYNFPDTAPDDDLRHLDQFLSMDKSMDWFGQVNYVASIASSFFVDSGTLADCIPSGMVCNQITVCYMDSSKDIPAPRCSADARSLSKPSFYLESSARQLPPLTEAVAAFAQTHIRACANHPMYAGFGDPDNDPRPERPIEKSEVHHNTFFSVRSTVREMLKSNSPD